MAYVFEKYASGGSGTGGSGGGIIDVTELPTDGVDEQSIYRVANTTAQLLMHGDGECIDFGAALAEESNATIVYIVCDQLPSTFVPTVMSEGETATVYVVRSTGEMYISTDGTSAVPLLTALGLAGTGIEVYEFKGLVSSTDEITEDGLYTLIIESYTYHGYKNGVWTELSNSESGSSGGGLTLYKQEFASWESAMQFIAENTDIDVYKLILHDGQEVDGIEQSICIRYKESADGEETGYTMTDEQLDVASAVFVNDTYGTIIVCKYINADWQFALMVQVANGSVKTGLLNLSKQFQPVTAVSVSVTSAVTIRYFA